MKPLLEDIKKTLNRIIDGLPTDANQRFIEIAASLKGEIDTTLSLPDMTTQHKRDFLVSLASQLSVLHHLEDIAAQITQLNQLIETIDPQISSNSRSQEDTSVHTASRPTTWKTVQEHLQSSVTTESSSSSSSASDPLFTQANHLCGQSNTHNANGNAKEALESAQEALDLVDQMGVNQNSQIMKAGLYSVLAKSYNLLKKPHQVVHYSNEAMALYRQFAGTDNLKTVAAEINYANFLFESDPTKHANEAEPLLKRGIAVYKQQDPTNVILAQALFCLANLKMQQIGLSISRFTGAYGDYQLTEKQKPIVTDIKTLLDESREITIKKFNAKHHTLGLLYKLYSKCYLLEGHVLGAQRMLMLYHLCRKQTETSNLATSGSLEPVSTSEMAFMHRRFTHLLKDDSAVNCCLRGMFIYWKNVTFGKGWYANTLTIDAMLLCLRYCKDSDTITFKVDDHVIFEPPLSDLIKQSEGCCTIPVNVLATYFLAKSYKAENEYQEAQKAIQNLQNSDTANLQNSQFKDLLNSALPSDAELQQKSGSKCTLQ